MDSERRHAPRYPFIADAAVVEISSDTKLAAKTSDVSIGGCFLDMLNPTPQGTEVRVRISHEGATFTGLGRVVFILPNMGMGVTFTSIDQDQRAILQKWVSKLSHPNSSRFVPCAPLENSLAMPLFGARPDTIIAHRLKALVPVDQ